MLKHCAIVAAFVSLIAARAAAQPTIDLVDNLDGTATLQVIPDSASLPGSVAVELDIVFSGGLSYDSIVIGDPAIWDTANPGDSPFIPGSPIGGDSNGLNLSGGLNVFISYGSAVIATAGPTDLLHIDYSGTGTITAGANADIVAQAATTFNVGVETLEVGVVPSSPADFDMDGDVDFDDFGVFVLGFQSSPLGGPPFDQADFDEDGDVDFDDFGVFVLGFQTFPPVEVDAVPEPGGALLAMLAACGSGAALRRG